MRHETHPHHHRCQSLHLLENCKWKFSGNGSKGSKNGAKLQILYYISKIPSRWQSASLLVMDKCRGLPLPRFLLTEVRLAGDERFDAKNDCRSDPLVGLTTNGHVAAALSEKIRKATELQGVCGFCLLIHFASTMICKWFSKYSMNKARPLLC